MIAVMILKYHCYDFIPKYRYEMSAELESIQWQVLLRREDETDLAPCKVIV